ncbi:hypothetical protein [Sinanaerobacter chloroacetimidivorans]|uniref:Uncharacterized protein n=1 Tax=Sinanaerobacter chloroacetimidivorans TaxID=2818044 RepID=A0A8J8B0D6_9FIRM|nr:hypothetical protein [Sinanaerobacter chloroacetimidivorans]MBR0597488.1 hypothetical protein [Sinanaerobacter chloroacetimidivorans]
MSRPQYTRRILCILLCSIFIFSGLGLCSCSQKEDSNQAIAPTKQKVDAPPEVLELAQQEVDRMIQFYSSGWYLLDDNDELAKIKILDSQITNLQLAKRIDVYDRLVGQRVIDGIKSGYYDFYFFSYRLLPDENELKGKSLSFELDEDGWISFEKITPYTSDSAPGDLLLIASYVDDKINGSSGMTRTHEFSDGWCERYVKEHLLDYDAEFTEDSFRVIDEYSFIFTDGEDFRTISLDDRQFALPAYMKETGRKLDYTDYYADYWTSISYVGPGPRRQSGGKAGFFMRTLNYNMPDADDALAVVIYMCTDGLWEPKTYRGIAAGSSEKDLLRLYPDDLYYLDKGEASGYNEIYQRNEDFDYAYFYFPKDQTSRDITFYIKDRKVSFIEMISAYERRYVYGGASEFENLVNQPANEKSEFRVETAAAFSREIELPWEKIGMSWNTGEPYISRVNIKLPRVSDNVCNGDAINSNTNLEHHLEAIRQFEAGDYSLLYKERLAEYSVDYEVHTRKGAAALVINEAYGIAEAGGGRHRTVWYYDCDTGNVLSSRQYAKKCGVGEAAIIKQYNDNAEYSFINSVYEANFYIDEAGKIVTFENFDT